MFARGPRGIEVEPRVWTVSLESPAEADVFSHAEVPIPIVEGRRRESPTIVLRERGHCKLGNGFGQSGDARVPQNGWVGLMAKYQALHPDCKNSENTNDFH